MKITLKQFLKYFLFLILLNSLLLLAGYLLNSFLEIDNLLVQILVLSSSFSVISVISYIIFLRGQTREPDSQTFHTLVSLSLKFLLDMILALVWFFVIKKTATSSVYMFFVIYLTLTLFLILVVLKTLKNRDL